jgi:SWI/SNF-related matrix-associated actin-dependent regulator of chromatin subfamily A member 5
VEGEAKRNKRSNLESLLKKIASVKYPMQELELNCPTTEGKVYSEENRYILCRLNYYGMTADDVYEHIKEDITEFTSIGSSRASRIKGCRGGATLFLG